jgi:hypothetical protein
MGRGWSLKLEGPGGWKEGDYFGGTCVTGAERRGVFGWGKAKNRQSETDWGTPMGKESW